MPGLIVIAYDIAILLNCVFGTNVHVEYAKSKFLGVWLTYL